MNRAQTLIRMILEVVADIIDKLKKETKNRNLDATGRGLDSLDSYTGEYHHYINEQLRHGIRKNAVKGSGFGRDWSGHVEDIKHITSHPTAESFTAYRGINHKSPDSFTKGDIIHDKGFVSTSVKRSVAKGFASGSSGTNTMFKIHITPGTRGAYVEDYSNRPKESEFLLHPGTKFRVGKTHLNKDGQISHVDLHIHSQED